jgi:CubicO group peptidase (beta-lactamase class C family)
VLVLARTGHGRRYSDGTIVVRSDLGELGAYIEGARVAFDVPGAAVAVIRNGELEYAGAFGRRAAAGSSRVDRQTRFFMIGSVTQSMTTTLSAALVDQGEFEWDDALVEHLPTFALSNSEWTPLVSLRDVFSHQSDVPRRDTQLSVDAPDPLGLITSVTAFPAMAPPGVGTNTKPGVCRGRSCSGACGRRGS